MITSPLDEIVIAADAQRCIAFFASMKEPERKLHAARALQWVSAINGLINQSRRHMLIFDKSLATDVHFFDSIVSKKVVFPTGFSEASLSAARIATLASCTLVEVKKLGLLGLPHPTDAVAVLKTRQPSWLDKWCTYILKEAPASHFMAVHELEQIGLCQVERTSAYWTSMLCSLSISENLYEDILSKDAELREEVWCMLDDASVARMLSEPEQITHEIFRKRWNTGRNVFDPMQVASRDGSNIWCDALLKLTSEGLIDVARLTDYSFVSLVGVGEKEAKKSPVQDASAAEFAIKLNKGLTKQNPEKFASQFASLLGATHKDVSTYAASVLMYFQAGALNVSDICSCISPAFLSKSKEPADAALKLLARLAKDHPDKLSEIGRAILPALGHSSKDIHRKTLALIETTNMLEQRDLLSDFSQRLDLLGGLERTRGTKLVGKYLASASTANSAESNVSGDDRKNDPAFDLSSLLERAKKLDKQLCMLVRLEEAIDAIKNEQHIDSPVVLDSFKFPRLNPQAVVEPVIRLDDLIYLIMKVWSGKGTALELELALDGVSRLCNERPSDFAQKTDALKQKALKIAEEHSLMGWSGMIAHLVLCWLNQSVSAGALTQGGAPNSFFTKRCLAVAGRAARKQSTPLLAMPTHQGGWIDPLVLVQRGEYFDSNKIEVDEADVIQSLLRLAPDNRKAALNGAAGLRGEFGKALRFALGDDARPAIGTREYWIAAFRARTPKETSSELQRLLPTFGPDGAVSATFGLRIEEVAKFANDRYSLISTELPNFLPVTFSADPQFPGNCHRSQVLQTMNDHTARYRQREKYALYPTVLLHDNSNSWFSGTETYTWLHNRESLLALYAKRMLQNIDSIGSYWQGEFELLFDEDISMAKNGRYFLCIAMSSKNNDLSRLAVDALSAAVKTCRIGAVAYGEVLAAFLPTGVITAVRWIRGMRDMSKISVLHAHFTWLSISTLLEAVDLPATKLIPFLELLTELQLEFQFSLSEKLRALLSGIDGSGKPAKLAKAMLSFKQQESGEFEAAKQALDSRISRVERWQSWMTRFDSTAAV